MKQLLFSAFLISLVSTSGCKKSKDDGPLEIVSGKENVPFSLKKGQRAKIDGSGNQVQITLTNLSTCIINGFALGTGFVYVTVTQGASSEELKIIVPKCSFQQGDSLSSATTQIGKRIVVNAVQYKESETFGVVNGIGATLTVK